MLNRFDQSFVPNFLDVKTFLVAPIVPINLDTCSVVDICCDWLWGDQINHIRILVWFRVILLPFHPSVRPPFLPQSPSKNEVMPIPIHTNKITEHRLYFVYRPSQQYTNISPIL